MRRPFLSSYKDRHGKQRWRYRRNGITVALPGQPDEDFFEAAYSAALEGRPVRAEIVRHPKQALPRTLKAAWRLYVQGPDWRGLRKTTQNNYVGRAERLLEMPVASGAALTYADVPVADLKRRHIKDLLASMADRPHAGSDVIVILRKIIGVALDQECDSARSNPSPAVCAPHKWSPRLDRRRAVPV